MSLILDALRKADSEREREVVPGLHTQPVPPLSLENRVAPARPKPWLWIAFGVSVGLLLSLAWYVVGRESAPAPAAPPPVAASETPGTAPAPPAPPAPITAEPPREIAPPAPWSPERKAAQKAPPRTEVAAAPPAEAAQPPILAREQLPENIRSALPPLAVGGSIYSSTPANRSLILDGQLYRENDQLSADLSLEEIRLKSAVLRFRGYRFEIRY